MPPESCAVCGTTNAVHWCDEADGGNGYACPKHCPAWKWAVGRA